MSLFDAMKGVPLPTTEAERNELVITEISQGFWEYHLSRRNNILRALCNAPTVPTAMPLSTWGSAADAGLPKSPKWCEACARIAWPEAGTSGRDTKLPG